MTGYLIAKYVEDIRRNEPVNVGVIVFDDTSVVAQFDGEDRDGRMDKRRIRKFAGRDAYVAWVDYWRRVMDDPSVLGGELADTSPADPQVIDRLVSSGSGDFYLEQGGTILLDLDGRELRDAASQLYARLVKPPDPPAAVTLQEKSLHALREAGADLDDATRFKKEARIRLMVGEEDFQEEVSYAVRNGTWHYLQEVSFDTSRQRANRKEAHHAAFVFEHAQVEGQKLVLYDSGDVTGRTTELLRMIERFAPLVDVAESGPAAEQLHERLSLD